MAYTLIHTPNHVEITVSGATTLEELMRLTVEITEDSNEARHFLVDVSALDSIDLDYAAITRLIDHREALATPDRGSSIAIVAQQSHLFGMSRMVELRTEGHARTVRAFS